MRTAQIADAILFTARDDIARSATEQLKLRGVSNISNPRTVAEGCDALTRCPRALTLVDWHLGAASVVQFLTFNRKRFAAQGRPIIVVADKLTDQLVATAAEYGVAQLFTEDPTPKNLGSRLASLALTEGAPDEVRKALADAYEARSSGDLKSAIQTLTKTLAKHPQNLRLKCDAAETLMQSGEWEKAERLLVGMEKTKPPYLRGIHLLGRCHMKLGRFDQALLTLKQANAFNPHDADRLVDVGQAFLNLDRPAEARSEFEAALELDPDLREAHLGLGECALLEGDVNKALDALKDVASKLELASVFNTCAVIAMRAGRGQAGMSLYQSGIKVLAGEVRLEARLRFNMGLGYRRFGKKERAREAFAAALKLDPRFARAQDQITALDAAETAGAAPTKIAAVGKPKAGAGDAELEGTAPTAGAGEGAGFDFGMDLDSLLEDDDQEESLLPVAKKPA